MTRPPNPHPEWTDQSIIYRATRSKLIFVRCTPTEHAQLTALARNAGRTVANLIRLAILRYTMYPLPRKDTPPKCSRTTRSSKP